MKRICLALLVPLLASAARTQDAPEFRAFLREAARGNVDRVKALLDEHPGWIKLADSDAETALHHAAGHGQAAVVTLLLERGAPIDARAYNQFTPLHLAVMHGNVETVRRLLARTSAVEARTSFNRTALQLAAENDRHALQKVLLDHGATYDLHTAACRGDAAQVQLLAGEPETRVWFATLRRAIERGHADVVRSLLQISHSEEVPPMMVVRLPLMFYGTAHVEVIRALIAGGFDPLERGPSRPTRTVPLDSTVLHHAAGLGHVATLQYLLDFPLAGKVDAVDARDRQGRTPFQRAAAAGHVAAMAMLAKHGADAGAVDAEGQSAVHLAAVAGHLDVVKWLVGKGVLDGVDAKGRTAATLIAESLPWDAGKGADAMRVLELLQRLGSPIDLHAAAVLGDAARVRALLGRADAGPPTAALAARAVLFDRPDAVAAFIDAGLDPNARHWHERTLLHVAVIRDAPHCARWLLDHGADPTLVDAHGKLARHWLTPRSSPELRAIFE